MASGMRNMKMSLIYEIRKCPVVEKKPDGAVEIDSSSFFAVPLPSPCRIFIDLWVKFSALRRGMLILSRRSITQRLINTNLLKTCM